MFEKVVAPLPPTCGPWTAGHVSLDTPAPRPRTLSRISTGPFQGAQESCEMRLYGSGLASTNNHSMCFVYFKKAFDSIFHDKLRVTMMDMGYPLHTIDLLATLYKKQLAKVKVAGTLSEWFRVKKGVRQCRVLSPYFSTSR